MITSAQTQVIYLLGLQGVNIIPGLNFFFWSNFYIIQLHWLLCLVLTTMGSSKQLSKDVRIKLVNFHQGEGYKINSETAYFHFQKHY